MQNLFSLVDFKETLIARLWDIRTGTPGKIQKPRAERSAKSQAVQFLLKRGYNDPAARRLVQDAVDHFELEWAAED